jgi:hypothetical protein
VFWFVLPSVPAESSSLLFLLTVPEGSTLNFYGRPSLHRKNQQQGKYTRRTGELHLAAYMSIWNKTNINVNKANYKTGNLDMTPT